VWRTAGSLYLTTWIAAHVEHLPSLLALYDGLSKTLEFARCATYVHEPLAGYPAAWWNDVLEG